MNKEKTKKEVKFCKRWIQPYHKRNCYTNIRVERNGNKINPTNYKEGDTLYVLRYDSKRNWLEVNAYEITKKDDEYAIKEIHKHKITYINEIYTCKFSEWLQEDILNLFKYGRC